MIVRYIEGKAGEVDCPAEGDEGAAERGKEKIAAVASAATSGGDLNKEVGIMIK